MIAAGTFVPFSAFAAPPPVITAQPQDTVAVYGGTATFTVAASSGTALSYQWYKDGLLILDVKLTGETRASLVLENVSSSDEGRYFVRVSNAGGTVTSYKARLTAGPNSVPVANSDHFAIPEEMLLVVPAPGVLANDTDVNNQPLSASLLANVTQGSLTLNADGSFAYTPPSNYFGSVSFAYCTSDSHPILLEQNNSGGNDRQIPVSNTAAQSFKHGAAGGPSYMISKVVLYLSRRSGGSGNLKFSISSGVNTGEISGSEKLISTSVISNTSDGSSFQSYTVTYDAPIGPFTAGTTYYLNFANQASERFYVDVSGSSNPYGNGTYFEGGISQDNKDLRFQIYETLVSSATTVTIDVTPVNDPPVAEMDWLGAIEDTPATLTVLTNDYDIEGSPLTITGVSTTNGTAYVSGTNIIFLPATNYNGWVLLNYTISDGNKSALGNAAVLVFGLNDPPLPSNDVYATDEDTTLTVAAPGVIANDLDVEGDPLSVAVWNNVAHGTLTLNTNGGFTYVPHADYHGPDSFTYLESDGQSWSATLTTVNINVSAVNDVPLAQSDSYTISAHAALIVPANDTEIAGVLANDSDADGDPLTAVLVSDVAHGTLIFHPNGAFSYEPHTNYFGTDSFTYRASDGSAVSDITTVSLTVQQPVPNLPLSIQPLGMQSDGFHFEVSGPAAPNYVIEASVDLTTWIPLSTNSGLTGTVPYVDTSASDFPVRFYRASAQ